jgi:predicted MFS family arabinose efflux permease
MRGLLSLVAAVALVDTAFFAVLTPLLPGYAAQFALSKAAAGVLSGAFAGGVLVFALPSGFLAGRIGLRPTLLVGLGLTAVSSLVFGFGSRYSTLLVARFAAGIGSACSWTSAVGWLARAAPPERRGEYIGFTVSAAVGGSLLGPVLGAVAARAGAASAFAGVTLVCLALAWWVTRLRAPGPQFVTAEIVTALRDPRLRPALALILLAPLLFGVLSVLVPLTLGVAGWGADRLGLLYVGAAALEATVHPAFGRWADRRGPRAPVSAGLATSVAVLVGLGWTLHPLALAGLVVVGAIAFGATLVPGMALLAREAEQAGLGIVLAIALANLAWAVGHAIGAPGGGWLGDRIGDRATYLGLAGLCLAALAAVRLGALPPGPRSPDAG